MKRYLFSAIGTTDPIRDFHDGALLHIIRYFSPDYVCYYMTKGMIDIEEEDIKKEGVDRYLYCLNMIKKVINKDFAVEVMRDEKMVDPSDMDVFYRIFLQKINEINQKANEETNGEYEILLNVSSGTPSQKATLQVIATLGNDKIKAIQVKSPHKKANPREDNEKGSLIKDVWETNDDNGTNVENRTNISEAKNFIKLATQREIIKELINNYDYSAVYELLCMLGSDEHLKSLVKSAIYRLEMNLNQIGEGLSEIENNNFIVNVGSDILKNVEYILGLGIKLKKNNYTDFIRGITPIIVDLFERACIKIDKNMINSICDDVPKNMLGKKRYIKNIKLDKIKVYDSNLLTFLNDKYLGSGGFREGEVSSSTYLLIMEYCLNNNMPKINQDEYDIAKKLRDVEQNVRNIVAHEIEYMSDEKIKEITGISAKKIYNMIVLFANYCNMKIDDEKLESYNRMNCYINDYLDKMFI